MRMITGASLLQHPRCGEESKTKKCTAVQLKPSKEMAQKKVVQHLSEALFLRGRKYVEYVFSVLSWLWRGAKYPTHSKEEILVPIPPDFYVVKVGSTGSAVVRKLANSIGF